MPKTSLRPAVELLSKYLSLLYANVLGFILPSESIKKLNIDRKKKTVALIMPLYNRVDYTKQALSSYLESIDDEYNYIFIAYDNNSSDGTRDFFYSASNGLDNIYYTRYRLNMGVTWSWNEGMRFSIEKLKADYIFLTNNDVIFFKRCIGRMIDALKETDNAGLVGPLSNCPGTVPEQNIRRFYPAYKNSDQAGDIELTAKAIEKNKVIEIGYISGFFWGGASAAFKRNIFAHFFIRYYFDPRIKNYGNEGEFESRFARTGLKILLAANVFVFHYGGMTACKFLPHNFRKNKQAARMINITVFSKDRACQLDAFLRSYRRFVEEPWLVVIFDYSSSFFKAGYDKLMQEFPWVNFVKESDFKADLLQHIDTFCRLTTFFVDDCVFNRVFSWDCAEVKYFQQSRDIACLSLRLSPAIDRSYLKYPSPAPRFYDKYCWDWRSGIYDWAYPMSIDGNIYKTEDILPLLIKLDYKSPNTLESILSRNPLPNPKMMCFKEHIIFNIPQNIVQSDFKNPYQKNGLSAKQLNKKYLNDEMIDVNYLDSIKNNSVHFDVRYQFKKR